MQVLFSFLLIKSIGIYPIQLVCNLFNHEKPIKITATGHLMETGVDECCTIVLLFSNNRMAQISISTNCAKFTAAFLIGEKGVIQVKFKTKLLFLELKKSKNYYKSKINIRYPSTLHLNISWMAKSTWSRCQNMRVCPKKGSTKSDLDSKLKRQEMQFQKVRFKFFDLI